MRALLDTHVFLWWLLDDQRLSPQARTIMRDGRHEMLWSAASSWELAIKISRGLLRLPGPLGSYLPVKLREQGITLLPVEHVHTFAVVELPHYHRDPFDRLLVAQARVEEVPLMSADPQIRRYDVEILW